MAGLTPADKDRDRNTGEGPPSNPRPERRQITVMFCDLVGSTPLTQNLDPEDVREVIARYRDTCCPVIERYGGSVSRFMGDGILVLFGYPAAHEDDGERAALAGLDIVKAMSDLNSELAPLHLGELRVRVGIATGLVIAGDRIGQGAAGEDVVVGEAPNLAARLQAIAEPNTVVISNSTFRLLAGRIECQDLGVHALKGFVDPQQVWQVLGPRSAASRFEAAHAARVIPLVDRVETMARLVDYWAQARSRAGQLVVMLGDPGIGKSRLIYELRERIASETHRRLSFQCSPYYSSTALFPFIEQITRSAGLVSTDSPGTRLAKLARLVSETLDRSTDDTLSLLATLVSVPLDDPDALAGLSAERIKQKTIDTLVGQIEAQASQNPLLMTLEDAHWIDPTSLELLDRLVQGMARRPILLVLTARPSFVIPWQGLPYCHSLPVERLGRRYGEMLVEQIVGDHQVAPDVVESILARTDGNPLYVEEITKALVDAPKASARHGPAEPTIPPTLQDSLMARLDQMGGTREIAQVASVLGRQFSRSVLTALVERERRGSLDLVGGLERLVAANILVTRGHPPNLRYQFRHALVRDAAYDSLLRRERERLHARLVEVLESDFPDTATNRPELLAQHCAAARHSAQAVDYWLRAGCRAAERSENQEAVNHLRQGLVEVTKVSDVAERERLELALRVAIGAPLISTKGPGSAETEENYTRALALCEVVPESEEHFKAHWGWWRVSLNHRIGRDRADTMLALAQRLGDRALLLQAHHCEWATLFHVGDQKACCEHAQAGLALYDVKRHRQLASIYGGHDAKVCGHGELALSLWLRGYPNRAMQQLGEALSWAAELRHAGSLAHARDYALLLGLYRQDAAGVRARAEQMIEFATGEQLPDYLERARMLRGWAIARLGDASAGLAWMEAALEQLKVLGTKEDLPMFLDLIAALHAELGDSDTALDCLQEAFAESEQAGIHFWLAELHRRRTNVLERGLSVDECEAGYRLAMDIARQQDALVHELAAATDLAALYYRLGRAADGRNLLAPIYGRLERGLDSPAAIRARTLLSETS